MKLKECIVDVLEDERFSARVDDLLWQASKVATKNAGYDPYDCGEGTRYATDESRNIIGFWAVPKSGKLYSDLIAWHGGRVGLMASVRNAFEDALYLYFVSGIGYNIFDEDLFGGDGQGDARYQFCKRFGYEC